MTAILDIGQGHQTHFGRGTSKQYHIEDWFNLAQRIKM